MKLDRDTFEKEWAAYLNRDSVPPSRQQMSQLIARVRELKTQIHNWDVFLKTWQIKGKEMDQRIKVLERALEIAIGQALAFANRLSEPCPKNSQDYIQQAEHELADTPDESQWVQNDRMEQGK